MAENLQNNDFSNLVIARSIRPGTIMLGIADGEMCPGDMVTFDHRSTTDTFHVRRLTHDEVESFINHDEINTVERVARARRHANLGETIEFIIDQCCDYVVAHDINALPMENYYPDISSPKLHKLDEDYPHICYKCKKKLKYLEAWTEIKKTEMTEERFKYLWELEQIEFYCCSCYDKEVRKEKPFTHSIYTPHPNVGRDFLARMRNSGRSQTNLYWALEREFSSATILPPISTLFPQVLQQIRWHADHHLNASPLILETHQIHRRTISQFRFDIRIAGDLDRQIVSRLNNVVTIQHQERFEGIPPVLDLTIQAPEIGSVGFARLVAEAVFHWVTALVLLHPEGEEWIPLDQRPEILGYVELIVRQMNNGIELVGEASNERFQQVFPHYPHIWDMTYTCMLCGLTRIELDQARGIMSGSLGWHREYELSMSVLDGHEQPISGTEQNELNYQEWLNDYLSGPHEHYYGPTGEESTCRYCGDVRNAIQRTNNLSEL